LPVGSWRVVSFGGDAGCPLILVCFSFSPKLLKLTIRFSGKLLGGRGKY